MLTYNVLLFAGLSEACGQSSLSVEVAEGANVADLIRAAEQLSVGLKEQTFRVALNSRYVGEDVVLPANAEIAFIPPVSGG
jgi:molybdopterin converting factor subunit 1